MNNNYFIRFLLKAVSIVLLLISTQAICGANADTLPPVTTATTPTVLPVDTAPTEVTLPPNAALPDHTDTATTTAPVVTESVPDSNASPTAVQPDSSSAAIDVEPLAVDLVDERPSTVGAVVGYTTKAVGWVWDRVYNNVFYWISPPSPGSLISAVSQKDASRLFKLLNYAGYKLKVIDTDVGIIPGLKIKFGQVKELSEADVEFLEGKIEEWEQDFPGMYDGIQRSIIKSVLAVNASGDYRVTTLEIKLLPLPDVAFTMIPKKIFLGEEASNLMMAIQRVERGIREIKREREQKK